MSKDKHGMPTYKSHSDRTRYVRTTSYSHMENEVGAPGRMNAAGGILKYGSVRSAAADWSVYPLGTKFRVKGQPHIYVVDDYGSALAGTNTIDIFKPSLRLMRKWGTRKTEITVIQWGSYERSARMLKGRTRYHHCNKMYVGCKRKLNSRVASKDIKKNGAL
ncbi:MAG: 3D domain-containing protein [Verrucomicrobiae bacterium]|nr:3D domain-containing protein [Verrucomicrobiae bacterium]NNJ41844.1 3D domain-containing protein [Akkermansiaceae bacterium]